MRRVAAKRSSGVGAGRGLVHRKHLAERAIGFRWYGMDGQLGSPADHRGDVSRTARPHRPRRASSSPPVPPPKPAGRALLRQARARPASAGCRHPGSRTPRSGARYRSTFPKSTRALIVDGARQTHHRAADPREASARTAITERLRPPTGPSVGTGSVSVETRPARAACPTRSPAGGRCRGAPGPGPRGRRSPRRPRARRRRGC